MPKTVDHSIQRASAAIDIEVVSDGRSVTMVELNLTLESGGPASSVTGIARCAPHDTFDAYRGFDIGFARALRRLAQQVEENIPAEDRDVDPRDRASAKAIDQLNRERAHWKDAYERLSEKVGYPADGSEPDSNLLRHAKQEMTRVGLYDPNADYGGMLAQAVEDLVRMFAAQGHSGGSAFMVRDLFGKLTGFHTLSPLTDDPAEWNDVGELSGEPMWQSRRRPDAFSTDGGKTYYLLDGPGGRDTIITAEPHTPKTETEEVPHAAEPG